LYSFSYFEFVLNIFTSEAGSSLAEPSKHVSGFHISTLIALVIHNMVWMKLYKFNPNKILDLYQSWNFILIPNWIMKLGTLNCWYQNGIWVWEILWYLILGQTYIPGPSWYIKRVILDRHWYVTYWFWSFLKSAKAEPTVLIDWPDFLQFSGL
jgi:hypothetical protein